MKNFRETDRIDPAAVRNKNYCANLTDSTFRLDEARLARHLPFHLAKSLPHSSRENDSLFAEIKALPRTYSLVRHDEMINFRIAVRRKFSRDLPFPPPSPSSPVASSLIRIRNRENRNEFTEAGRQNRYTSR